MTDRSSTPDSGHRGRSGRTPVGAWAGFGGAAAALAAAIVIRLLTGVPTGVERVAEAITIVVPVALFDAVLSIFGTLAKPGLVLAVAIGVLVGGAVIGWLAARTRDRARAIGAAAGLVAVLGIGLPLVLGYPDTALAGIPAALVYIGIFANAYDPAAEPDPEADENRRKLLQWAAVLGVLLVAGGLVARLLAGRGRLIAGALPAPITPNPEFYVVSKNLIDPSVDVAAWRLKVGGLVAQPMQLTLDALRALGTIEQLQTLECISNEVGGNLISTALWRGVPLASVLARARPTGAVVELKLTSEDGYSESIPLAMAADERVLLAFEMNGAPLPEKHGFPLRLLLPGVYGMKGPKWLSGIEAVDQPYDGYWERRGWTKQALIKTMSRLDAPASSSELPLRGAPIQLAGIAFAGDRGIQRVELQIGEDAAWVASTLDPPQGEMRAGIWRFWHYAWRPTRTGTYALRVRAVDGSGAVQSAQISDTLPDGASGYDGTSYTIS